jgi:oligopeptide transport system ATP-binding protein
VTKLLQVENLQVDFTTYAGVVKAVRGVSFGVEQGEVVAIVGESGCGKSVTAQSLVKLIPSPPGKVVGGSVLFNGEDLAQKSNKELEKYRGKEIGIIFQDPMTSLNPTMTVGNQIVEMLAKHGGLTRAQMAERAQEMLRTVGIPNPRRRFKQYPHQFSGGMRQRAMIAMALACSPKLLIADEPTTALDVTIQAQILELIQDLKEQFKMAVILITHDLGVVAGFSNRVIVMYAGKIVEAGSTRDIYRSPQHPYTKGLLAAIPRLDTRGRRLAPIPGRPPNLLSPPDGCPFWPRCDYAMKVCAAYEPEIWVVGAGHNVSCWLHHPAVTKAAREVG